MMTLEQFATAHKANLETLLGITSKTFDGLGKVFELNTQAVQNSLSENLDNAKQVLATKDTQEFLALSASMVQPIAEKVIAYSRQFYEIAAHTQAELAKAAEEHMVEGNRKLQTLVDGLSKNAPAGSETTVAMIKTAINTANTACESLYKAAKQAVEITGTNIQAAATAANKATQSSYEANPNRSKKI